MSRTAKFLSARISPGLPVREGVLRRGRRFAYWGVAALAICWLLWETGSGDDRVYHAGSISAAHQFIANDCARCHQAAWQPVKRLAMLDNDATSTPDAACIACHQGTPHHADIAVTQLNCSHCHREHHGQEALAAINDRFCTSCHANLQDHATKPVEFVAEIASFAEHPEFALFRDDHPETPTADSRHGVHRVAVRNETSNTPPWQDRTNLRFNHKAHMQPADPRGLPTPALHSAGVEVTLAGFERLDCESCHQRDGAGAYFKPIAFEQQCRRCHPLEYDATLQIGDALPHRDPSLVRDVLRSRLADRYLELQGEDAPKESPASDANAIPGAPRPRALREGELAWVNERLAVAEHVVFGREAKGGCRLCHLLEESSTGFTVAPTDVPDRWQAHARFNHQRHRLLDCTACHTETLASATSADILLPGIATCRACHGAESGKSGAASDRCVECHDYHDHALDSLNGGLGLDLLPVETRRRGGAERGEEKGGAGK
jgi:hypothetical protein